MTVLLLSMHSCQKTYEEEYYTGKVLSASLCNTVSMAYVIELTRPEGIGDTLTYKNKLYKNVVMGYDAPEQLKIGQELSGVMYQTRGYANLNCMVYDTRGFQEIILLSVDEDIEALMHENQ